MSRSALGGEVEDGLHLDPLLALGSPGRGSLVAPHEILPLLHFRVGGREGVHGVESEGVRDVHDHEEASAERVDLHVQHTGGREVVANLRPDALVVLLVVVDERRVVFQVERQAVPASRHRSRLARV